MFDFLLFEEKPFLFEHFIYRLVCIPNLHAAEVGEFGDEFPLIINWIVYIKTIFEPHLIVFLSMSRCCVNKSCSLLQCYMTAKYKGGLPFHKGVFRYQPLQLRALKCIYYFVIHKTKLIHR